MVLVDTSIWISHLRDGNGGLESLLNDGHVVCHPFVIGELACGNIKKRDEILALLQALPTEGPEDHDEVMAFMDNHRLMGRGLGYIDMHLLASAMLSRLSLWTDDKRLHEVSVKMGLGFRQ